ncbi:MAG: hypothetical protein ACREUY_06180, partial [Burkholderiales bacterium]
IAESARKIGNVVALGKMVEFGRNAPMHGGVTPELLAALKPDMSAFTAMLDASNRRAEQAEQRNHELVLKMMDQKTGVAAGAGPLMGELFKYLKPQHLEMLLNPAQPESNWLDTLRELAKDFAPALQMVVARLIEQSGIARPAGPPVPAMALPAAGETPPTPPPPTALREGSAMPLQLAPEGEYAKKLLLEYIKTADWHNALAALDTFPAFVPGPTGMMPVGPALLNAIDPTVHARIYVGQLMLLMPEIASMTAEAEKFIEYIQKDILKNDEAARRQGPPTPELKPTSSE